MNREQLAHVLRAAATIVEDGDILVVGSQSILGSVDADRLPEEATRSVEADLAFFADPNELKMDRVDGEIGEDSQFHATYGYYAQGVALETSVLPEGWRDRLIPFGGDAPPSEARCLERHDLIIAKLVAGREKDVEFVTALVAADLVDVRVLLDRALLVSKPGSVQERVRRAIERCAAKAGYG